jgi:hypothetical protein
MGKEEVLLEYWRELPIDAQEQVLELAKSLKQHQPESQAEPQFVPQTPLGKRLWEIRQKIVISGVPLLSDHELEREILERRGGWQEE